jgi:acyl-CoA synthetase (AMP-forming)/AMP-acid ligase II
MKSPTIAEGPNSLLNLFAAQMARGPELDAIHAPGRVPLSYRGLHGSVDRTGRFLAAHGLGSEDRIVVVLRNGPEMAAAFAAIAAWTACAPLNPDYREAEFEFYLADLQASALVVEFGIESPARKVAERMGISILELIPDPSAGAGCFRFQGSNDVSGGFGKRPEPAGTALLLHTSGTTSRPKLVPITQANLCASARHIAQALKLGPEDRCLNVMPLFHIHGLIGAVLSSWSIGGSVVCASGWDANGFFDWLGACGPTWYTAVPTIHQSILASARQRGGVIRHGLRFIRSSSAALPPAVMAELEQVFGVPAVESYGMTEATHQMCSNPLPPGIRKPGSVGLPAGPEVAVMDAAGALLGTNETGELVIRGPNVTPGYVGNPEANAAAFTEGWFRTGDQGYRDRDGYFFLTGRLKELINRGGEKVAPREVDEVLLSHPAVGQAVAFAVPHPRLGEDVAAAVVLRQGSTATEPELRQFCLGRLAPQKAPTRFVFVEAIPKGPTGKIQRIGLAKALASSLELPYVAPVTPVGEAIAGLWQELLGCRRVGLHDNFFALGGDSLMAARSLSRLGQRFGVDLPIGSLFQGPTLEEHELLVEGLILDQIEPEGGLDRPFEGSDEGRLP